MYNKQINVYTHFMHLAMYVHMQLPIFTGTVFYWLIAMATITLDKRKGAATKRGWLLCKVGH